MKKLLILSLLMFSTGVVLAATRAQQSECLDEAAEFFSQCKSRGENEDTCFSKGERKRQSCIIDYDLANSEQNSSRSPNRFTPTPVPQRQPYSLPGSR